MQEGRVNLHDEIRNYPKLTNRNQVSYTLEELESDLMREWISRILVTDPEVRLIWVHDGIWVHEQFAERALELGRGVMQDCGVPSIEIKSKPLKARREEIIAAIRNGSRFGCDPEVQPLSNNLPSEGTLPKYAKKVKSSITKAAAVTLEKFFVRKCQK